GAALSDRSFGTLIQKGADDEWLLECVAGRHDIPSHHLRELLSKASEIVRERLTKAHPELRWVIEEIFPTRTSTIGGPSGLSIDYKTAEGVVDSRELTEAVVYEYAKTKQLGEIIVSIAR